jgi:hypothetical protein
MGCAAVVAALGLVLAVRGYRLSVRCDSKALIVRGMFRSRRISKLSIRAITVFPAVRWSSSSGRIAWTPIIAFAELGRTVPQVTRRNEDAIEERMQAHLRHDGAFGAAHGRWPALRACASIG